jgi:hypothetical protein
MYRTSAAEVKGAEELGLGLLPVVSEEILHYSFGAFDSSVLKSWG